jgi:hypothetical protein
MTELKEGRGRRSMYYMTANWSPYQESFLALCLIPLQSSKKEIQKSRGAG